MTHRSSIATIVLAAGLGTRMNSSKAKVLHEIAHRPMIHYVLETAKQFSSTILIVVGHQSEEVRRCAEQITDAIFVTQKDQFGTGHATACTLPYIPPEIENVIILCGDTPLLTVKSIEQLIDEHLRKKHILSILTAKIDTPSGYGRIVRNHHGEILEIVEEKDTNNTQKAICEINTGVYCINTDFLKTALPLVKRDNAQKEIYLTDIVKIAHDRDLSIGGRVIENYMEIIGVNTVKDIYIIEKHMAEVQLNNT